MKKDERNTLKEECDDGCSCCEESCGNDECSSCNTSSTEEIQKIVDEALELNKLNQSNLHLEKVWPRMHDSSGNKLGRNSPCPCESGKKYKKCCLS